MCSEEIDYVPYVNQSKIPVWMSEILCPAAGFLKSSQEIEPNIKVKPISEKI